MNKQYALLSLAALVVASGAAYTATQLTAQVAPDLSDAVIIDNSDENPKGNFTFSKQGQSSEQYRNYFGYGYNNNRNHAMYPHRVVLGEAAFSYVAERDGEYLIGVTYPTGNPYLGVAKYTIDINKSTVDTTEIQQGQGRKSDVFSYNSFTWVPLGMYSVKEGEEIRITQTYTDERRWTLADAAFILRVGDAEEQDACSDSIDNDEDGYTDYLAFDVRGDSTSPWQRQENRYDVNGDRVVNGRDIEIVTLSINNGGARVLGDPPPETSDGESTYARVDVNGDGNLSPADINALNMAITNNGIFKTPDPDCESADDDNESNETGDNDDDLFVQAACSDGEDNDNDGMMDFVSFATIPENPTPWQRAQNKYDVDGNNVVNESDRNLIIAKINNDGAGRLPDVAVNKNNPHYDVNGDMQVTPSDINALNTALQNGEFSTPDPDCTSENDTEETSEFVCGNGEIEEGEECDDGNTNNEDYCLNTCKETAAYSAWKLCASFYGDNNELTPEEAGECINAHYRAMGTVEGDKEYVEELDFNNSQAITELDRDPLASMLAIENLSALSQCGDGEVQEGETCDDGTNRNGDGCSNMCIFEFCGDGTVQKAFEECDDGNTTSGDGCNAWCKSE